VILDATRRRAGQMVAVGLGTAVILAGCGSSGHPKGSASSTTSTTFTTSTTTSGPTSVPRTGSTEDPNQLYNPIPFNVGDVVGLPNGWSMQVRNVKLSYAPAGIAPAPDGQQYVGVEIKMVNVGTGAVNVNAAKIFVVADDRNGQHPAVAVAGHPNGLDGVYAPGAGRTGELVFAVPFGRQLRMLLDGPAIGTQRTVFQIDPPKVPSHD
jgi:hypothetical protein